MSRPALLRCDCCGVHDSATNPVIAVGRDRLFVVSCEACRMLGLLPRFARRVRRSTDQDAAR